MSGLVNQTGAFVAGGVVPFRMGNSHPSLFPYEPLPCADGELIITAGNDIQFRKLAQVLGLPELPDDPRFARQEVSESDDAPWPGVGLSRGGGHGLQPRGLHRALHGHDGSLPRVLDRKRPLSGEAEPDPG